ncbi:unnamed protein product, partial [Vitis vinifera]
MEWRKCYLDVVLVPLGLFITMGYHVWLWHKVRTQPLSTFIGMNVNGRRFWVSAMMKDNDKKNILAVQTLRNAIMGSTLMATTSILLCCGLAAVISSTYSVKKPLNDTIYGAHGEFMMAVKGFREGVLPQHSWEQALLHSTPSSAMDLWACSGFLMLNHICPIVLQP